MSVNRIEKALETAVRCLVIESNHETAKFVESCLNEKQYDIDFCNEDDLSVGYVDESDHDVIILDDSLSYLDGRDSCEVIRERTDAYIVVVAQEDDEMERIRKLTAGADDFIAMPSSVDGFTVRLDALLRRPRHLDSRNSKAPLSLDAHTSTVEFEGKTLNLTPFEFVLLELLSGSSGKVVSRSQVAQALWGDPTRTDDHALDVHVSNLRKKLNNITQGSSSTINVEAIRGLGYRFTIGDALSIKVP